MGNLVSLNYDFDFNFDSDLFNANDNGFELEFGDFWETLGSFSSNPNPNSNLQPIIFVPNKVVPFLSRLDHTTTIYTYPSNTGSSLSGVLRFLI